MAGFEPATSDFQGRPSDLADNTHRKLGFVSRTRTYDKGPKSRMLVAPVFPKVTLTSPRRLISRSFIATCSALPGLTVFGFKAYAIVIAISY